jgi:carbon-monoxide dehydrogenase medium subunit
MAGDPRGWGGTAMISHPFTYEAPSTIEEAVQQLGRSGEAKVIAGGHSLLPLIKLGLSQPEALIDLRNIASLREIRTEADGTIAVGALATHRTITHDQTVRTKLAALAEAAGEVGDLQVRARGTIGGSLAHADSAADEPAPTLAYDAVIRVVGPAGRRDIAARDYFKGVFETALAANEIIAEIRFPAQTGRTGGAYAKFSHPASGFAVTGVAAVITLTADGSVERAAIAVTGATAAAYRATQAEKALIGTKGDAKAIAEASAKAAEGISALSDLAASGDYRKNLVTVYAKRAIQRAVERAKG